MIEVVLSGGEKVIQIPTETAYVSMDGSLVPADIDKETGIYLTLFPIPGPYWESWKAITPGAVGS